MKAIMNFMFGVIISLLIYGAWEGVIPLLLGGSITLASGIAVICANWDSDGETTYVD